METKISKIEAFLGSLEKKELEGQQTSILLKGCDVEEENTTANNCGRGVNCAEGCGEVANGVCVSR